MPSLFRLFLPLSEMFLKDKSSFRFAIGIIIGLAFSMTIILSTIGIMDGFDFTLKKALRQSVGDLYFYGREGFFTFDQKMQERFKDLKISHYSPLIQTESFLIVNEESKGILLRGVETQSFKNVTGMDLGFTKGDLALGAELAEQLNLKVGDEVVLTFVSGNQEMNGLPVLRRFKIGSLVRHGIYQKDMRLVYMERSKLQELLGVGEKVNIVSLNVGLTSSDEKAITNTQYELKNILGDHFSVKPYWSEYGALIEAVQIEKKAIGLTLQTIVVIAIFNVLAFVIFLNERHSRSLFLFKAMGLSQKGLLRLWFVLITGIWIFSCALSLLLVKLVGFSLANLSLFKLPADIYYMGQLNLLISSQAYIIVFAATYFWLVFISWLGLRRMRNRPILQGLRREFA